mgnify:CR=1 FL=1
MNEDNNTLEITKPLGIVGSGSASLIINRAMMRKLGWDDKCKVILKKQGPLLTVELFDENPEDA